MLIAGDTVRGRVLAMLALVLTVSIGAGRSQEQEDPAEGNDSLSEEAAPLETEEPVPGTLVTSTNAVELPYFMRRRSAIPEFILTDKREGVYYTGIPLIGYDPEQGFNYGLAIQRYWWRTASDQDGRAC